MCPSLIQIGSKTAEKNYAQTNKQTNRQTNRQTIRHYENNGHLAVNQLASLKTCTAQQYIMPVLGTLLDGGSTETWWTMVSPARQRSYKTWNKRCVTGPGTGTGSQHETHIFQLAYATLRAIDRR